MQWIDAIVQGVLLGGLYALFATGMSLGFGIMRLVNIAHGDFIVLAAYLGLSVMAVSGLHPLVATLVVVPLMALLGYLSQRLLFNRTLGTDITPPLLVTFALSLILQNLLLEIFSADSRRLQSGDLVTTGVDLVGGLKVGVFPVLILVLAVVIIAALQWMFSHTDIGRSFRAASDDREISQLMGLDNAHVYGLAMALAFAIMGLGGVLLGMKTTFDPTLGASQLIFSFEAVIIGGMGSLWGTLAGGMVLGVSQTIGYRIDPGWGLLFGHLSFLAILAIRPQGLFPKTRDN
ncbi:MAG: branched-chain amino acid ABC transporter permease [Burkholderiaceae bacterium]